jgi:antitoxin component of RelBE/YafQ-DinJ toxin-antitoxin module
MIAQTGHNAMKKKEATLRTRVQTTFAAQVDIAAQQIGLNMSEYMRLALIEKLARDKQAITQREQVAA